MKKLFILCCAVTMGISKLMGQGQVNLNNGGATGVYLEIGDPLINGGVPVKVGTPALAAGFTGAGPGQVAITVWGAPQGTSLSAVEASIPLFVGFNLTSSVSLVQGMFNVGNPFNLTTANVPGWDGSSPLEFVYLAHTDFGFSAFAEAQNIVASTGIEIPPAVFGSGPGQISSFMTVSVIPEPTTIALGGLGAAGVLLFRRRK